MNIADAKRLVELEALVLALTDRAAERREFMGLVRQHGDGALVLAREVVTLRRQLAQANETIAMLHRTRTAAREVLALDWAGPTPADEGADRG